MSTDIALEPQVASEPASRHPVNRAHYDQASFGEQLADRIAAGIGSWPFLIVQSLAVLCWILANVWLLSRHPFDAYPFVLLNLMFSVQAAYTGPVLLLAGNRQAQKDRLTLEHAAAETEETDRRDLEILTEIKRNTELTLKVLERVEQQGVKA